MMSDRPSATFPRKEQNLLPGWSLGLAWLLIVATLARFAYGMLPDTSLWYDEAVQFLMSKGVNAFDLPGDGRSYGVKEVMLENARGNLDPGGFTVLLHYWMVGGVGMVWLRILPFLFFLVGLAAMAVLGWRWRGTWGLALVGVVSPLAFPFLLEFSTEVRAYSMEFAGVAVGALLLSEWLRRGGVKWAVYAGLACGFFLTSRYAFFLVTGAISLVWCWAVVLRSRSWSQRWAEIAGFAVPVAICLGVVMVIGFMPQYEMRISVQDGVMLNYLAPSTAEGKGSGAVIALLVKNLLSLPALPLTAAAAVGLVALLRLPGQWRRGETLSAEELQRQGIGVFAFGNLLLAALLWRWHPWNMGEKWSMYLHAVSAVLLLYWVVQAVKWWEKRADTPSIYANVLGGGLFALAVVGVSIRTVQCQPNQADDIYEALRYLDSRKPGRRTVGVETGFYPGLRYFYEYGELKGRDYYPSAFRLPLGEGASQLVDARTKYLISYFNEARFAKKHPDYRVVPVSAKRGSYPNMMRIEKREAAVGNAADSAAAAER